MINNIKINIIRNKIIYILEKHGFRALFLSGLNYILIRIFNLKLVKHNNLSLDKISKNLFKGRRLKKDNGYFYCDPMPADKELADYYKNSYWGSREKSSILNIRDLIHYNLIKKNIPNFFKSGSKSIANIGSGLGGGISHLFKQDDFDIINVDLAFSDTQKFYKSKFKCIKNIKKIKNKSIDLVYSSHQLEHVSDINKFKLEISRILKPNSFLFFEVPNAKHHENGARNNKIDIPHTYYFTTDFFSNWFDEIILNQAFDPARDKEIIEGQEEYINEYGKIIIAFGKL